MRVPVLLFAVGVFVAGCKDPGAEVTPATVETPAETKTQAATAGKATTSLAINPSNSKIEFVGAKVTASHPGGFTDFAGKVDVGDPIEKSRPISSTLASSRPRRFVPPRSRKRGRDM
jgi:polyisoprenoid-binding protein YceI